MAFSSNFWAKSQNVIKATMGAYQRHGGKKCSYGEQKRISHETVHFGFHWPPRMNSMERAQSAS